MNIASSDYPTLTLSDSWRFFECSRKSNADISSGFHGNAIVGFARPSRGHYLFGSMASKSQFPDLEDGILVIPPQMKHTEVVQYIRTYKDSIRQIVITDRTEGMKKLLKEIEHCANLECIEIKQCGFSSKLNLKNVFKNVFDKCPKLKQVSNVQIMREQSGVKNFKTMIKRKGSTIVEIGLQSETMKD